MAGGRRCVGDRKDETPYSSDLTVPFCGTATDGSVAVPLRSIIRLFVGPDWLHGVKSIRRSSDCGFEVVLSCLINNINKR